MKHFKLVFQNPHFMIVIDIFRQGYDVIESCKRDLKRDLYYCPPSLYFEVWQMNLSVVKKITLIIKVAR